MIHDACPSGPAAGTLTACTLCWTAESKLVVVAEGALAACGLATFVAATAQSTSAAVSTRLTPQHFNALGDRGKVTIWMLISGGIVCDARANQSVRCGSMPQRSR